MKQVVGTKEAVKVILDKVGAKANIEWHSQAAHKLAVAVAVLDIMEITDAKERDEFMALWLASPASFGTNASAMGQSLGRESAKAKLATTFAGF